MRSILGEMQSDPKKAQAAMNDPLMAAKLQKASLHLSPILRSNSFWGRVASVHFFMSPLRSNRKRCKSHSWHDANRTLAMPVSFTIHEHSLQ